MNIFFVLRDIHLNIDYVNNLFLSLIHNTGYYKFFLLWCDRVKISRITRHYGLKGGNHQGTAIGENLTKDFTQKTAKDFLGILHSNINQQTIRDRGDFLVIRMF